MEEEWKRQEEAENNKQPEFVLLSSGNNQSPFLAITEVDGAKAEDGELADLFGEAQKTSKAYDGELTAMTFNHVKNSHVFQKKHGGHFDLSVAEVDEDQDFNQWLSKSKSYQSTSFTTLQNSSSKKSEDGWPKSRGAKRLNHALSFRTPEGSHGPIQQHQSNIQ